jgi:Flp pilus assembly protein TadG
MYRRAVGKRKRGGSIALQVAVVLPVVLMFFFSLIDLSRFITMRQLLVNGAREGARLAAVSPTTTTTQAVQNAVSSRLDPAMFPGLDIQVYRADPATGASTGPWSDAALGDWVAVEVTANYVPLMPSWDRMPSLLLRAKCLMPSEGN